LGAGQVLIVNPGRLWVEIDTADMPNVLPQMTPAKTHKNRFRRLKLSGHEALQTAPARAPRRQARA
jgi:hypothetical protein